MINKKEVERYLGYGKNNPDERTTEPVSYTHLYMNYVVIDLEMCKVPKLYRRNYKHANETIRIGAVLLDSEFKKIATLRIF